MKNDKVCAVCEKRRIHRVFATKISALLFLQLIGFISIFSGITQQLGIVSLAVIATGAYAILSSVEKAFTQEELV